MSENSKSRDMLMFSDLRELVRGTVLRMFKNYPVQSLSIDSRKAIPSEGALFFAISGERHDGHHYIPALYKKGFRQFVVERKEDFSALPDANILLVSSTVFALQDIVATHRSRFDIPVVGITGSNGKTIVKEWLYQLLSHDLNIVKNPGSYNSQTGVPLSVWELGTHHQFGIFEAGISKPDEMIRLEKIIQPTLGIFTNAGTAHDEGFKNKHQKIREKLLLFKNCKTLVYCKDHQMVALEIEKQFEHAELLSWGTTPSSEVHIEKGKDDEYRITWNEIDYAFQFPFSDAASVENVSHCITVMLWMKYSPEVIQERILNLRTIPMRLELKQGINGCQIIDDTYNNDLAGLQISLDFLAGIQSKKSVLILSDILQSGLAPEILAKNIADLVGRAKVDILIGIGSAMTRQREIFEENLSCSFYPSTEDFLRDVDLQQFQDEVILIKGARPFAFEKIVYRLVRKIHGTIIEVDLGAMVHNLNFFKSRLKPGVKLMAMVKAFAYGSGSEEVASLLQYHGIDYLGVAYADEGAELRKNKIRLPIMVMNPSGDSFESLIRDTLEPEIYSFSLLKAFAAFLDGRPYKIHLKIDTGMHRLGIEDEELSQVLALLKSNPQIEIASIFSHLAGADESTHDDFTREQGQRFVALTDIIKHELGIDPVLHILNSSGILRFPEYQFGMVRLGIGLYGINPTDHAGFDLRPVATLKTVVSQIKKIKKGQTIGYGRMGRADNEMTLATLAIGYADGFSRSFSRGVGEVSINGHRAPVIGNVCMDMTMVDITGMRVKEGDEVIIFGRELPIAELATKIHTIPYEILTGTSERVKRVFYAESI